jgi:hypothetical protein
MRLVGLANCSFAHSLLFSSLVPTLNWIPFLGTENDIILRRLGTKHSVWRRVDLWCLNFQDLCDSKFLFSSGFINPVLSWHDCNNFPLYLPVRTRTQKHISRIITWSRLIIKLCVTLIFVHNYTRNIVHLFIRVLGQESYFRIEILLSIFHPYHYHYDWLGYSEKKTWYSQ